MVLNDDPAEISIVVNDVIGVRDGRKATFKGREYYELTGERKKTVIDNVLDTLSHYSTRTAGERILTRVRQEITYETSVFRTEPEDEYMFITDRDVYTCSATWRDWTNLQASVRDDS